MKFAHRGDYDAVARLLRKVQAELKLSTREARRLTDAHVRILSQNEDEYPNFEPLRFIRIVEE